MPLTLGTRLGPYEITGPLGKGGMGEVYRAKDTKLGRDVAIKVLPNLLARDPERLARFEREAKVLASLNHPNIATIYSLEEFDGGRAIAMELVEGTTLPSPQPLDTAVTYAKQIADALEAAHEKGVTHRDLKPANIMVTPAGLIKVLDFGLAAVARPSEPTGEDSPTLTMGMTDAGMIMGTAAYMAPEQAVGSPVDKRADVWSFGVVLWQMLVGKTLFSGDTTAHILASVIKDPIEFGKLPDATPAPIRELLRRCLDRDVKTRLQVISEARIALQRFLADPRSEPERPVQQPPSKPSKLPWAIATGFAVTAAVALGYLGYQRYTEAPPRIAHFSFEPTAKGSLLPLVPPAVSPDGRHIVYGANNEGKLALWMRDVDSSTARQLTELTGGRPHPFWSPDSRFVAFFDGGKLKKLDVSGGPAITLCDANAGRGGSWSKNDVILFSNTTLFRVSAAGGTPVAVTDIKENAGATHRYPWFLPDGHHFLYTVRGVDATKAGIYYADLDAKGRTQVSNVPSNAVYTQPGLLLFVRDRTLMSQPFDAATGQLSGDAVPVAEQISYDQGNWVGLFSASERDGVLAHSSGASVAAAQITWFDRAGKSMGTVGTPADIEWTPLSPDGTIVAENRRDVGTGNNDVWLHDLARGTASRLTFAGTNRFPVWSPDGARVAYLHQQDGKSGISTKASNGTGKEESLGDLNSRPTDWSRDGRYVFGETSGNSNSKTKSDIWVYPQFGDKKPFPFLQSEFVESEAKLSPDGRWLAYHSDESKRNEVYVVSFPDPGGKWQISTDGGHTPVWSRDGRELYFVSASNQLMSVPVKLAGTKLEAGQPKALFEVRLGTNVNFDVSKDGRFLIPTGSREASSAPMDVVLNWQAALKK